MPTAPQYVEIDRIGDSSNGRGGDRPRYFLLHTQEGHGTAESLAGYLNDSAHQVSYHYTLRDGVLVDVVDTDLASWSVGDANSYTINLCFAGSYADWGREQWLRIEPDLAIAAYIAVQDGRKYGFSTHWLGSGGRYSPAPEGVTDHRYITDVIGWGSHVDCGPGFPGDVFARYLALYSGITSSEGNTMALPATIIDAYGNPISVAELLKYMSYHADLIIDQLGGPGTREGIPGQFPGWPQLGDKTVVDSLADAHAKLDMITETLGTVLDRLSPPKSAENPRP